MIKTFFQADVSPQIGSFSVAELDRYFSLLEKAKENLMALKKNDELLKVMTLFE